MPLTPIQGELRLLLEGYLTGERSMRDFRSWEITVADTDALEPADAEMVGRLALIAETVERGAADEPAFEEAARSAVRRLRSLLSPSPVGHATAAARLLPVNNVPGNYGQL